MLLTPVLITRGTPRSHPPDTCDGTRCGTLTDKTLDTASAAHAHSGPRAPAPSRRGNMDKQHGITRMQLFCPDWSTGKYRYLRKCNSHMSVLPSEYKRSRTNAAQPPPAMHQHTQPLGQMSGSSPHPFLPGTPPTTSLQHHQKASPQPTTGDCLIATARAGGRVVLQSPASGAELGAFRAAPPATTSGRTDTSQNEVVGLRFVQQQDHAG